MSAILVVDDQAPNREFLRMLLGYRGHEVAEAEDGAEALKMVRARRPDLVICDILMPTMDGFAFVENLRAEPSIADVPVIFFTAHYLQREAKGLAEKCHVRYVLTKPAEPEMVLQVIDAVLGQQAVPVRPVEVDAFREEHLRIVTDKLSQTTTDLRNANERLAALIELNLRLASESDPQRLLDQVARGARQLLGTRCSALGVRNRDTGRTEHFVTSGLPVAMAKAFGLPPTDRGILGEVLSGGRAYRAARTSIAAAAAGLPAGFADARALLAVPIVSPTGSFGWLCVMDKLADGEFDEEDERLLSILAAQTGRIYENGSLYRRVQAHAAEMEIEIAERERAERGLRESEQRFRHLAENIREVFWLTDPAHQQILYVSPAYEEIWGRTCASLYASPGDWLEAIHPADRERVMQAAAKQSEGRYSEQYRIIRPDGAERWVRDRAFPVLDKDGRVFRIAGVADDITEAMQAERRIRESEGRYRSLVNQAADGIFISDAEGTFVLVNPRGCELLGYTESELLGMNGSVTYVESERAVHARRLEEVRTGATLRFERLIVRKDGSTFPAEISIKMLDNGLVQVIFHDITGRREQENKIARLHRIQAVLSSINSAIVRIHDRDELFREACRIATEHGAFPIALFWLVDQDGVLDPVAWGGEGAEFIAALPPSARKTTAGVAARSLAERATVVDNDITHDPDIHPLRREAVARGAHSVISLPLFQDKEMIGVLVMYGREKDAFDDEEVKLLEELAGDVSFALTFIAQREKVDYLAYYDTLTGLPNRSLFLDRLGRQLATATRERTGLALILLDLDRFRMVNDSLGRQAGDALLRSIGTRLKGAVRDEDTVARISADGFAIAASGNWRAPDVAHLIEARNGKLFGAPFAIGGEELRISATAGIAVFPRDGGDPETLLANAEAALRNAKHQNVAMLFYSPEMNAEAAELLRMENRLRLALERQELALWYQPKVDAVTGKIAGFEALMRWIDPDAGVISPAKFIPIMESTGLITEAGRWALMQVAVDCRQWVERGVAAPRIAVNVSPLQLREKQFISTVIEAAQAAEEAGGALDLEITEGVIMGDVDGVIPMLQTIRGLGVDIYVDDFGTGYSSLAYIARLPIQSLKIDRSFIGAMTRNEESLSIVRSVISLAHSLKLRVVAEGVETEGQADLLRRLECDEMQGYLYSSPVPAIDVPALYRRLNGPRKT